MRSNTKVWLAAGVCGVLAAGAALWALRPDLTQVPIDRVDVVSGGDGRALRVHLTYSSCQEFVRLAYDETTRNVRLAAFVHDLPTCGTVPTTSQVVPLRLEYPLWDRPVLDYSTSRPLTVAS